MKKVLVICGFPAPYRVAVFKELANFYDLTVYFRTTTNENRNEQWFEKSDDLKFHVVDNPKVKKRFKDELKHIKNYDFVLPYEPSDKLAMEAIFSCRVNKIPYYVNCDGAILRKNLLKDVIKRFLFTGATGCFSSGQSATNYFKYYGVPENKIFTHKFTSLTSRDILPRTITRDEQLQIRNSLNIDNKTTIISVGQFIHRKGFDVLLRSWKKVKGDCQLFIIGGGNEKEDYEKYIQKNHISNVYIMDFMPKELLFRYYKASDFFVLPTREDIWGLVVNEALAVGLPVITTDNCVAGIELIKDGINGYIVPVEDEKALTDKIQVLVDSYELLSVMKKNTLDSIREYTLENIAKSHICAIEKTLSERKKE